MGFSLTKTGCPADQTLLRCASSTDTGSASSKTAPHTDETQGEALKRRLRESARVEERVTPIYTKVEFEDQLSKVRQQGAQFGSIWACLAPSEGHLPDCRALALLKLHAFRKARACSLRQIHSNCLVVGQHEHAT